MACVLPMFVKCAYDKHAMEYESISTADLLPTDEVGPICGLSQIPAIVAIVAWSQLATTRLVIHLCFGTCERKVFHDQIQQQ